jgi:[ribosomal protein S5]-alanine N-acetyltransferase
MTTITTQRLVLRPLTADDAEALHPGYSDPDVLRYWHQLPTTSLEETRALVRSEADGGEAVFAIRLEDNGKAVGWCGFVSHAQPHRQTAFGYFLLKEHWGNGIAAEAARAVLDYGFDKLGLLAAELWIYDGNERSRGVAHKLGARYRGANVGFNLLRGVFLTHVYEVRAPGAQLPPEVVRVIPVLQLDDVGGALAWYRDHLRFAVEWSVDDPPTMGSVASPGWLPLAAVLRFSQGPNAPVRLALAVPDRLDEYAASIVASGVALQTEPTSHPWGMRTFEVVDPWGNTLVFETARG